MVSEDRIGIKPLYYSVHNGRIVFASEIKALLRDSEQVREVNESALASYLSFICTPAPDTMFKGIRKLEAGTWLRIDIAGRLTSSRWYDLLEHTNSEAISSGPLGLLSGPCVAFGSCGSPQGG